jgi:nitroreductase
VHRERQIGIAVQLFEAMGIERYDKEARQEWVLRGFRQFDAPVSIVVTYDRSIHGGDIGPFDCGAVSNALVNAAWSRGLGCVVNSQGIMQSPVVREQAGIPDDQVIMICVAMGFPDDSFPANTVVSERKSVEDSAVFVGFED